MKEYAAQLANMIPPQCELQEYAGSTLFQKAIAALLKRTNEIDETHGIQR